jgi:hypothetical protein
MHWLRICAYFRSLPMKSCDNSCHNLQALPSRLLKIRLEYAQLCRQTCVFCYAVHHMAHARLTTSGCSVQYMYAALHRRLQAHGIGSAVHIHTCNVSHNIATLNSWIYMAEEVALLNFLHSHVHTKMNNLSYKHLRETREE